MPIDIRKLWEPVLLTDTLQTIYTVQSGTNSIIENLVVRLTNTTGTAETVTGHSGAGTTTNQIFNGSIPPNDFVLVSVPVLSNGDSIQFKQTNTGTIINIQHESGLPKYQ